MKMTSTFEQTIFVLLGEGRHHMYGFNDLQNLRLVSKSLCDNVEYYVPKLEFHDTYVDSFSYYTRNKKKIKHGKEIIRFPNDKLHSVVNWKDGNKHGIEQTYFSISGKIETETQWKDGKKDGYSKKWNIIWYNNDTTKHVLQIHDMYKDGKKNGPCVIYSCQKQPVRKTYWKNGLRTISVEGVNK